MAEETGVNKKPQNSKRRNFRRTQGPQNNHIKITKSVSKGKKLSTKTQNHNNIEDEDDEDEVCVICTEKLLYVALTPCNHKTCHRCSFRQLALFNKNTCLICRTETDKMIFSEDIHSKFNEISNDSSINFIENKQYGIDFTSEAVAEATLSLLKYTCRLCDEDSDKEIDAYIAQKKEEWGITSEDKITENIIKQQEEKNLTDSIRRSRQKVLDYAYCNPQLEYFSS